MRRNGYLNYYLKINLYYRQHKLNWHILIQWQSPGKIRTRDCVSDVCSPFLLTDNSVDCVEECQDLLNRISLDSHNERRRRHVDTPDLVYDPSLCADAQQHANLMARTGIFEHDTNLRSKKLGENLYNITPIQRIEVSLAYIFRLLKLHSRTEDGLISLQKLTRTMKGRSKTGIMRSPSTTTISLGGILWLATLLKSSGKVPLRFAWRMHILLTIACTLSPDTQPAGTLWANFLKTYFL